MSGDWIVYWAAALFWAHGYLIGYYHGAVKERSAQEPKP